MCPSAAAVRRTEQGFWIRQGSLQERRQYCLDGISRKSALLKHEVQADHRGELVGGITKMERVASEAGKEFWMCRTKSCFQRVRLCAKRVRLLGSAAAERATHRGQGFSTAKWWICRVLLQRWAGLHGGIGVNS